VLTQVLLSVEVARHVRKGGSSVKRDNVSKINGCTVLICT
jgi:hypothetical protein